MPNSEQETSQCHSNEELQLGNKLQRWTTNDLLLPANHQKKVENLANILKDRDLQKRFSNQGRIHIDTL